MSAPAGQSSLSATDLAGASEPLHRIVARTLRKSPKDVKRAAMAMLGGWGVLVVLQIWDVWDRRGPSATAELLGVVAGVSGSALTVLAHILYRATEHAAAAGTPAEATGQPRGLRQVLIALPPLGFLAGTLLGFAIANFVVRGLLGVPLAFVVFYIAMHLVVLWLAAETVAGTTRFLFTYAQEQALALARAESEAADAQLSALQAQMNPHFLFNALNTVAALVRTDPRAAETTVEHLSDTLRRTLKRSRHPLGTVSDEIDYLTAYLAIERQRLGDRLHIEWAIAADTLALPLPPMTMQPLVENALRHGIGARLEGGRLTIVAERRDRLLRLTVADDGYGFPARYSEGVGLGNLRKRLATMYGDRARLMVEPVGSGARVIVEIGL
jgi:histidine kinase